MASIISTGIGSGLDIAGIVQQLVAAEGEPVVARLGQKEAQVQAKLSAIGTLKASLSEFRTALDVLRNTDSFLARKASVPPGSSYTASADGTAFPGNYAVEVVQLAQAQKLTSGAFADANAIVGTGTLQISVGASTFGIVVDSTNNTLAGIRDAIHAAPDNSGVSTSIVNAGSGSYLIVSGDNVGSSSAITITQSGGDGGLAALEYDPPNLLLSLSESNAAQDALIRIDGLDVSSTTNSITAAVQGVTIDLLTANPGVSADLTVANDETAARKSVNDFVDSYNALVDVFGQLASYDPDTQVAGPLFGDTTLRAIRSQVRRELSNVVTDVSANFSTLTEVGVGLQLDGKLVVDDTKLSAVMAADFVQLGQLFSATDGYAVRIFDVVDSYLSADGALQARESGLNKEIAGITDDRSSLSQRLASLETRLTRQFNAMDALLGQLNSTSNFLSQQLANLPGVTANRNNNG